MWTELKKLYDQEEQAEHVKKLKSDYMDAIKQSKTAGNTDALRNFLSKVRADPSS